MFSADDEKMAEIERFLGQHSGGNDISVTSEITLRSGTFHNPAPAIESSSAPVRDITVQKQSYASASQFSSPAMTSADVTKGPELATKISSTHSVILMDRHVINSNTDVTKIESGTLLTPTFYKMSR